MTLLLKILLGAFIAYEIVTAVILIIGFISIKKKVGDYAFLITNGNPNAKLMIGLTKSAFKVLVALCIIIIV